MARKTKINLIDYNKPQVDFSEVDFMEQVKRQKIIDKQYKKDNFMKSPLIFVLSWSLIILTFSAAYLRDSTFVPLIIITVIVQAYLMNKAV